VPAAFSFPTGCAGDSHLQIQLRYGASNSIPNHSSLVRKVHLDANCSDEQRNLKKFM
jgi:hypothetical protein